MTETRIRNARASKPRTAFQWQAYENRGDSLRLLRASKTLVDTVVSTCDGYSDTVHWQVLTALCPKLIAESSNLGTTIDHLSCRSWRMIQLPDRINAAIASRFIDIAYGKSITLDQSSLRELYSIALEYKIKHVIEICLNYSRNLLNIDNCVHLLMLSIKHRHEKLQKASYSMIRSNFKLVLHFNKEFHKLDVSLLKKLLLDDHLKLDEDEEFAWLAIVRWLGKGPQDPRETLEDYYKMVADPVIVQQPPSLGHLSLRRVAEESSREPPTIRSMAAKILSQNLSQNWQRGLESLAEGYFNFYTQTLPFDLARRLSNSSSNECRSPLGATIETLQTEPPKEKEICDLIKCLRFLRFRSVEAFSVILAHDLVKNSPQLTKLVILMRLIYMIKKRIPLNESQSEMVGLMSRRLDRIEYGDAGARFHRRLLRYLAKSIKLSRTTNTHGDGLMRASMPLVVGMRSGQPAHDRDMLRSVISWGELKQLSTECQDQASRPRVPQSVGILIGGWADGSVSDAMVAYDFVHDHWFKLNVRLPEPRAFHAACSAPRSSQIYIFGGTNGDLILNSLIRIDLSRDIRTHKVAGPKNATDWFERKLSGRVPGQLSYKFHTLKPMTERRCHLSGVWHSDGRLYALGGHNGLERLRSAERYDVDRDLWQPIADMTIARSDAAACSHENKIFVAGGQISDQFIQASVEFYKHNDDTWTFVAPMIIPRMSFKLVSYRNQLLAIGGTNGLMGGDEIGSVTRTVERYNGHLSSWSLCAPMRQKRGSFGLMNIEDRLVVAGGYGGHSRLKCCETLRVGQFRPRAGEFSSQQQTIQTERATGNQPNARIMGLRQRVSLSPVRSAMKWLPRASLPTKRSGFSLTVVSHLKNPKEFTYHGYRRFKTNSSTGILKRRRKFVIIKRRKLVKNLKIALVIGVVFMLM